MGNDQNHKTDKIQRKQMANRLGTISQRVVTQQPNRTKSIMNKHKVKRHRNADTKIRQQRTTSESPPWIGQ